MTTRNVIRKVNQSILRKKGATFGTGGGGDIGGSSAPTAAGGDFSGAGLTPSFFDLSLLIFWFQQPYNVNSFTVTSAQSQWRFMRCNSCDELTFVTVLVIPSRTRKRTDTRSGTACICPFKSISKDVVFVSFEAAGQIGNGTLVAENH